MERNNKRSLHKEGRATPQIQIERREEGGRRPGEGRRRRETILNSKAAPAHRMHWMIFSSKAAHAHRM